MTSSNLTYINLGAFMSKVIKNFKVKAILASRACYINLIVECPSLQASNKCRFDGENILWDSLSNALTSELSSISRPAFTSCRSHSLIPTFRALAQIAQVTPKTQCFDGSPPLETIHSKGSLKMMKSKHPLILVIRDRAFLSFLPNISSTARNAVI
jgi:hypothetical protein